jgi:hypothetical protein
MGYGAWDKVDGRWATGLVQWVSYGQYQGGLSTIDRSIVTWEYSVVSLSAGVWLPTRDTIRVWIRAREAKAEAEMR